VLEDRRRKAALDARDPSSPAAFVVVESACESVLAGQNDHGKAAKEGAAAKRRRLSRKTSHEASLAPPASAVKSEKKNSASVAEGQAGLVLCGILDAPGTNSSPNVAKLDVEKMLWGSPLGVQLNGARALVIACNLAPSSRNK
jgi:hypothetical protein